MTRRSMVCTPQLYNLHQFLIEALQEHMQSANQAHISLVL